MKNSNFAACLGKYFKVYLPSISGRTPQTIDSYRYAFILFLVWVSKAKPQRNEKPGQICCNMIK